MSGHGPSLDAGPRSFSKSPGVMGAQALEHCPGETGKHKDRYQRGWVVWEALEAPQSSGTPLSHRSWGVAQHVLPLGQG